MKKIVALALALIMAMSCCLTAFAATDSVETKFSVKDVDYDLYKGSWTTIEVDDDAELSSIISRLKFYMPSGFVQDKKASDADKNIIASFTDKETGRKIIISRVKTDKTIDKLIKELIDSGKQNKLTKIEVNGMVGYALMTEDNSLQVVLNVKDTIIQFEFTGADDAKYQKWIENMVKSITLA